MSTSSTVAWYSSRIRGGAKLSLQEELDLAREARDGSREALHELVEDKLAFVMKVVGEYRCTGVPVEDLLAEANLGLLEAARRFNPTKGCRFATYAGWWIRKAIFSAACQRGRLVKVSTYQQRKLRELRDAERQLKHQLGRAPTNSEIGEETFGLGSEKTIDRLLRYRHVEWSLDGHVPGTDNLRLADRLADPSLQSPEEALIRREERALLLDAIEELSAQEREVISFRFGLQGGPAMTLAELGARMGLSRERVRQVECQGKDRLRRWFLRRWAARPSTASRCIAGPG